MFDFIIEFFVGVFGKAAESKSAPEIIRCTIIFIMCGIVVGLGIFVGKVVPTLWGKILGFGLSMAFIVLCIYLLYKVKMNKL